MQTPVSDLRREAARLYRELGPVAYRAALAALGDGDAAVRATVRVFRRLSRDLPRLASGGPALVHRAVAEHCGASGRRPTRGARAIGCPTDLELEDELARRHRGGDPGPHAEACVACHERLAAMERAGEDFRQDVYPASVDGVMEAAADPWGPRRRIFLLLPVAGLAASAALLLLFAPHLATDELGPKRAPLGLAVYAGEAEKPIHDGGRAPPGAELRFRVRSASPCHLWLVAADEGGVARLLPRFTEAPVVQGTSLLPETATLEARAGPVRVYAVCSVEEVAGSEVERSVRAATAGGDRAVRRGGKLLGLPPGTLQATVLLERG